MRKLVGKTNVAKCGKESVWKMWRDLHGLSVGFLITFLYVFISGKTPISLSPPLNITIRLFLLYHVASSLFVSNLQNHLHQLWKIFYSSRLFFILQFFLFRLCRSRLKSIFIWPWSKIKYFYKADTVHDNGSQQYVCAKLATVVVDEMVKGHCSLCEHCAIMAVTLTEPTMILVNVRQVVSMSLTVSVIVGGKVL